MTILRIDHVGIAVSDLDTAIDFYTATFGLRCVHDEVNLEQGVREAMLSVGDGSSHIQLLAPLTPDSPIGRFLQRSGPGSPAAGYTVDDIEATCEELRGKGVQLLYDTPRPGTNASLVNFIHPRDAGGVLVELVQPAAS